MQIQHQTLDATGLQTISWLNTTTLVDWADGGRLYYLNGQRSGNDNTRHTFGFPFNRAITSADKHYAFIYNHLGTKGILLKNGKQLREINRSYYHAGDYEYPAAFATLNNVTYLIHCPLQYNQLDFEEVETGELVTNVPSREPQDFFHSRLEVSPDNRALISKGWFWHPWDAIVAFDIAACLLTPQLLDTTEQRPLVGTEVCTAGFVSNDLVLLGTSNEEAMDEDLEAALPSESIAFWNIRTGELSAPVRVNTKFGNLFPLDKMLAWDLYQYPKLLDLSTGLVIASIPELNTGEQRSAIIGRDAHAIAFDRASGCVAFVADEKLQILGLGT